jgi:hypothetical protein
MIGMDVMVGKTQSVHRRPSQVWIIVIRINSSLLEAVLLALIPQVCFCGPEINDLRATVSILLSLHAFFAEVGIRDALPATNCAPTLKGPEIAFVANLHQSTGSNIGVTDHTLSIALFAESPDSYSRLFPAEYQIWVVLGHFNILIIK